MISIVGENPGDGETDLGKFRFVEIHPDGTISGWANKPGESDDDMPTIQLMLLPVDRPSGQIGFDRVYTVYPYVNDRQETWHRITVMA